MYKISGWIKTEDIPPDSKYTYAGAKIANIADPRRWPKIMKPLTGTHDWTFVSCDFYSGSNNRAKVECRLGYFYAPTTGIAWFDTITLEELGR